MEKSNMEARALLNLHLRTLAIEGLAASYYSNAKALKLCLKFIKIEKREINICTQVSSYDLAELQHRYFLLTDIIKRLIKSPTPAATNKALEDLRIVTEKTQEDISLLREQLSPLSENVRKISATIDSAAQNLSRTLESKTQALSEKINDTVEEIRKRLNSGQE